MPLKIMKFELKFKNTSSSVLGVTLRGLPPEKKFFGEPYPTTTQDLK